MRGETTLVGTSYGAKLDEVELPRTSNLDHDAKKNSLASSDRVNGDFSTGRQ